MALKSISQYHHDHETIKVMAKPAILVMKNREKRKALRSALNTIGFKNIRLLTDARDAFPLIESLPHSLMLLEWQGADTIRLLKGRQGTGKMDTRPIMLFTNLEERSLLSIVSDYKIERVFSGPISPSQAVAEIRKILDPRLAVNQFRHELRLVSEARGNGDYTKALSLLSTVSEKSPRNLRISCEKAAIFLEMGRVDEAEDLLNDALQVDRNLPRLLHLRAKCALIKGDHEGAENLLRRSTILNPYHVDRLLAFGEVLLHQYKALEAKEVFDQVIGLDQDNKRAIRGRVCSSLINGQLNQGLKLLQDVSDEGERAAIFNNAGVLSVRHNRFDEAIHLYDMAFSLLESRRLKARVLFNKGLSLVRSKKVKESIPILSQALNLDREFKKPAHWLEKIDPTFFWFENEGAGGEELLDVLPSHDDFLGMDESL